MSVWTIVRIAATKIPWGRVMENVPAVVDMVGRAKGRFMASPPAQIGQDERLRMLQEENLKLKKAIVETSDQLQQVAKSLEVVAARQKMLMIATAVAFLAAVWSLFLWA